MSHYETLLTIALIAWVVLTPFIGLASYQKGCRDTWRAADKMAQVEPLLPTPREPQPIVLPGPLSWERLTANCAECQSEQEQAL